MMTDDESHAAQMALMGYDFRSTRDEIPGLGWVVHVPCAGGVWNCTSPADVRRLLHVLVSKEIPLEVH